MNDDQIKHMVDRFLGWKLPENFNPDAGISFARLSYQLSADTMPSGTNLFDADQAMAMVRYMVEGMPEPPASFRRIYDKMQRGKVSADERTEP